MLEGPYNAGNGDEESNIVFFWLGYNPIITTLYYSFYPVVWSGCFRLSDAVGQGVQK